MFLFIGERLQNRGFFHALSSPSQPHGLVGISKAGRDPICNPFPVQQHSEFLGYKGCHLNPWKYRPYTQKDNTLKCPHNIVLGITYGIGSPLCILHFGVWSFVWTWVLSFFSSLVPLSGVYSFIYVIIYFIGYGTIIIIIIIINPIPEPGWYLQKSIPDHP